jgi:hypothetical protein
MKRLITKFKRGKPSKDKQIPPAGGASVVHEKTNNEPPPHGPDRIQNLPPEVRRHLLSLLNLTQLKLMVRASPTLHQQYRHDRTYILCRSLEETLRTVTVDAYAVQWITSNRRTDVDIAGFLKQTYSQPSASLVGRVTQDEAVNMVKFYTSIQSAIADFAHWALEEDVLHLSRTEMMRLTRAVYRYQLLCLIADPSATATPRDTKEATIDTLIDIFEPWEVEEIFSFLQFAEHMHADAMRFVQWVLPPEHGVANHYESSLALLGMPVLLTVLAKTHDFEIVAVAVRQQMIDSGILFNPVNSERVMSQGAQKRRRRDHRSERHTMCDKRLPFPFRGDQEPSEDLGPESLPPLAWTMIWGESYSSLYGRYTTDDLRRWGYVFWDKTTFEKLGGERVLRVQWEQNWDGVDPRDTLD